MIENLVSNLVGQLNVNKDQAEGGAGLLFKLAKDKLSSGDFSSITNALGGGGGGEVDNLINKAPATEEAESGVGGMLGKVASMAGLGNLGTLGALAGGFKALKMDASSVTKFVPIVLDFVQKQGGDQAKGLLESLFKTK